MFGPEWGNCVVGGVATLSCILPLFQNIITAAIILSGVFAVFLLLFAGFKFIRSNGDPKQVDGARQIAIYAILGMFLIALSFFVIQVISKITNVDCLTKFGFSQCDPGAFTNSSGTTSADPALEGKWACMQAGGGPSCNIYSYPDSVSPVDGSWYDTPDECTNNTTCDSKG